MPIILLFLLSLFQGPRLQSVRPCGHRQPPQQHFRVQGLQEQDPDLAGQAPLRRKAALRGAHGHEHLAQEDSRLSDDETN